jgi:hypothetical protein
MNSIVLWILAATIVGTFYAVFILLMWGLIGHWGFVLAPGLFLALFSVAFYLAPFKPSPGLSTNGVFFLAIALLILAVVPAVVLYLLNRRPVRPSGLVQIGYGLGAFYAATVAIILYCVACNLSLPFIF